MMDARLAREVAHRLHRGGVTRSGEPLVVHLERVARAVPAEARALAYLHDALEHADGAADVLGELGLTGEERAVLALLTRGPEESYRAHVMRIAQAERPQGRIAREIKLADLDDHLRRRWVAAGAPEYAWARRQILASQLVNGEGHAAPRVAAGPVPEASSIDRSARC
jgi:hypothetical protein